MDRNSSLLNPKAGENTDKPKISIFMPTHRKEPDNRQDAIVFKNLLREVEEKLKDYPENTMKETLGILNELQKDTMFWNKSLDGLGILATSNQVEKFQLTYPVAPTVKVGNTFHILPLIKYLEGADEAYIADLSRNRIKLYFFDGAAAAPVMPEGLEQDFMDLFDDIDPNSDGSTGSVNGLVGSYHGGPSKADEVRKDREKYFRYLDNAFESLRKNKPVPFILGGTQENVTAFRDTAKGDFYSAEAFDQPLDSLSPNQINEKAALILENQRKVRNLNIQDNASTAIRSNLAETDPAKIQKLAEEGRVAELLVNDRYIQQDSFELDEMIRDLYQTGAKIRSLSEESEERTEPFLAILRY